MGRDTDREDRGSDGGAEEAGSRCGERQDGRFAADVFFTLKFAALTCQVESRAVLTSGCSHT